MQQSAAAGAMAAHPGAASGARVPVLYGVLIPVILQLQVAIQRKMASITARKKLVKAVGEEVTELEEQVAQVRERGIEVGGAMARPAGAGLPPGARDGRSSCLRGGWAPIGGLAAPPLAPPVPRSTPRRL